MKMSGSDLMAAAMDFTEGTDYPDGFLIETDLDEEDAGYYMNQYDYPVCNHTDGITDNNIGYAKGITADGVPFEAELFEKDDTLMMAVVIPAIFNGFYGGEEEEPVDENMRIMYEEAEDVDGSVLAIGMVCGTMEKDPDVVRDYLNFIVNNGVVTFISEVVDGVIRYCVDALGNDLVKISIMLQKAGKFLAYSDLDFDEFPKI